MQKVILADSSCLILLDKIGELALLQRLFETIVITKEVEIEWGQPLPEWVLTKSPNNNHHLKRLETFLDRGEASTIALAMEMEHPLLILDDLKARRFAKANGFMITGTLGILIEAKRKGYLPGLATILEKVKSTNFRISPGLIAKALSMVGEDGHETG